MRVLLADDSPLIRERVASMLSEKSGIEIVGQARDGAEALELVDQLHPDVLVLDIWMPKVNGIRVLEKIRRDGRLVTIIVFTGEEAAQHRRKCLEAGADYFLHKSKDFELLGEILQELAAISGGQQS